MGFKGNTIADLRSHVAQYGQYRDVPVRDGSGSVWMEAEMLAHREGEGHGKRETAGLIMEVWDADPRDPNYEGFLPRLEYVVLHNEAPDGTAEFKVGVEQLRAVFTQVLGATTELRNAALWHSHHGGQAEASTVDVESFPAWLCSVGFIYHVPTGTTLAYEGRVGSSLSGDSLVRGEGS
jgi:proteasome lid subunit RPN8/RPN11